MCYHTPCYHTPCNLAGVYEYSHALAIIDAWYRYYTPLVPHPLQSGRVLLTFLSNLKYL